MPRQERLQKILAGAGVASRRASERLITDGRVRVNGKIVTELGTKADPRRDKIEVDGRRIAREQPAYYVLNKPREVVSTLSDPEGRETIKDNLKGIPERVFPIGRLDYHTSGVLLLTNDGEMSEALLRPAKNVPKTYVVKVKGHLDIPELDQLRNGVTLDDGYVTKPAEVFVIRQEKGHTWIQMTLTEGKNRQIRRMGDALGRRVMRLSRTSFGGISIDGLRPGEYRPLRARELEKLEKKYLKAKRRQTEASSDE
jgi:23S rRNA pseudouridine2605 synthase